MPTEPKSGAASGFLDKVYGIRTRDETDALYRDWAETYDSEVVASGYASPVRVAAAMAALVSDKAAPVLDIGCGTGLSGAALRAAGFSVVDGTDVSDEMLAVARAKGVYRKVVGSDADAPLPAEPGDYANAVAVGVFSPLHAPPSLIAAALDILAPGGCLGFTMNDHAIAEGIYDTAIDALVTAGRARIEHSDYGDHLPARDLKSRVVVLRRL